MASRHPQNLSETQIKRSIELETIPGRQYKPRRRGEMSQSELIEILHSYKDQYMTQKDIAKKY